MEFQHNLEQIKEHEEANHSTPLLGSLTRLLGVQPPSFPRSSTSSTSRVSLLRRRPRAPFNRFPLYLHPEAAVMHSQNQTPPECDMAEYAFSSMPLYERPGFYSCPQTPIHCVPPPVNRPRPPRRAQGDLAHSTSSVSHSLLGSQLLPPDTPGRMTHTTSSALPGMGEDVSEYPSVSTFSFPDPVAEMCPPSKLWPNQALLSHRLPPTCLSMDTPPPTEGQLGPLSACAMNGAGERVFSFTPPIRNPIQSSMSSGCINASSTSNSNTNNSTGNLGNLTSLACGSIGSTRPVNRSTKTLTNSASAITPTTANTTQKTASQHNSPMDSGISLSEEDLLGGLMVQRGTVIPSGAREQFWDLSWKE